MVNIGYGDTSGTQGNAKLILAGFIHVRVINVIFLIEWICRLMDSSLYFVLE